MVAKIDQKKHGGKIKGGGDAPGAGPVQSNKTPAPDVISAPRASHSGYGQNSYAGPSSLTPNQDSNMGVSPLAANMKQASERGSDAVLDTVVQRGTARQDESVTGQLRQIADKNVPDAFGMKSARSRQPSSK